MSRPRNAFSKNILKNPSACRQFQRRAVFSTCGRLNPHRILTAFAGTSHSQAGCGQFAHGSQGSQSQHAGFCRNFPWTGGFRGSQGVRKDSRSQRAGFCRRFPGTDRFRGVQSIRKGLHGGTGTLYGAATPRSQAQAISRIGLRATSQA